MARMTIDTLRARSLLKQPDLSLLFVEELGWDQFILARAVTLGGVEYRLEGVAEKCGVQVFAGNRENGRSVHRESATACLQLSLVADYARARSSVRRSPAS